MVFVISFLFYIKFLVSYPGIKKYFFIISNFHSAGTHPSPGPQSLIYLTFDFLFLKIEKGDSWLQRVSSSTSLSIPLQHV